MITIIIVLSRVVVHIVIKSAIIEVVVHMICWQLVVVVPHQRSALLFTLPWLVRLLDHQFLTAMEFIPVW